MSEFIRIDGYPPDYAEKAFAAGYYLEALQTLHGWVECKLRELLLLQRSLLDADFNSWEKAWDVSNEFTLNNAAKVLFLLGIKGSGSLIRSGINGVRVIAVPDNFGFILAPVDMNPKLSGTAMGQCTFNHKR